jgi:hypothetical protein
MSDVYAIVDTARDPRLYDLVMQCRERVCLFSGKLEPPLDRAAPYLVKMETGSPLDLAWRSEGVGQSWGIFCRSSASLEELRKHFRKFLMAKLPDGNAVMFRFYDPRVWRTYWPSCNEQELALWLEFVSEFHAEDFAI